MSDGYVFAGSRANQDAGSGKVETTTQEAAAVKDTATDAAKDVAHVAKDEAASVAHETKMQLQDLYAQSRREFGDQAAKQQRRAADGLRSMGDELASMARNAEGNGMAADLVQRASDRISGAATWLSDRDPEGVLYEVKSFARRKPGVFIFGAAVAGVLVGRLTRALAAGAKDSSGSDMQAQRRSSMPAGGSMSTPPPPVSSGTVGSPMGSPTSAGATDPTPGFTAPATRRSAAGGTSERQEGFDERPNTL